MARVAEALAQNWVAPAGPHLTAFEAQLRAVTGSPHAVAVASGTAGLHLALRLVGVGPGDEVLVPSFNFVGCVNPIRYLGATPVLVDSGHRTWNICLGELRRALAERAVRPKAIMVVHLYGQAARIEEIVALARPLGIAVVEDAAECFGATLHGRALGTFGDIGVYSFNGNKLITTSGGGALVTARADYAAAALHLATQAREAAPHYEHRTLGYNYRLSNVCAAIGLAQLETLDERIAQRRAVFDYYVEHLQDLPLTFSPEWPGSHGTRWLTCLLLDPGISVTPEDIRRALAADQIEARPLWKPMHQQPLYADAPYYQTHDVSGDLFRRGLCLPSGSALTEADLARVVRQVRACFGR